MQSDNKGENEETLVSFGGAQLGDVSVRDVVGGNKMENSNVNNNNQSVSVTITPSVIAKLTATQIILIGVVFIIIAGFAILARSWSVSNHPIAPVSPTPTTDPVAFAEQKAKQKVEEFFQIARQTRGPLEGALPHVKGKINTRRSDVKLHDFIARIEVMNPYDAQEHNWTYGLSFGDSIIYDLYVLSDKNWNLRYYNSLTKESSQVHGEISNLNLKKGDSNLLMLAVQGKVGLFFVNGAYVATLDLLDERGKGDVSIVEGYELNDDMPGQAKTSYQNFIIWSLEP
jgi:hypothetical protein